MHSQIESHPNAGKPSEAASPQSISKSLLQKVNPEERRRRSGHSGAVVWLTGLPGAGKTTIATASERRLFDSGRLTCVLDGDEVRTGLSRDLGFSAAERSENVRRVAEVANLFARNGFVCFVALVSPFRQDREIARRTTRDNPFIEVHINASAAVCEGRDPKGLYAKARSGQIAKFTGVSDPYEIPKNPDVMLPTDRLGVGECVSILLEHLDGLISAKAAPVSQKVEA